jgi:hypothetical protein
MIDAYAGNANAELVDAARAQIGELAGNETSG